MGLVSTARRERLVPRPCATDREMCVHCGGHLAPASPCAIFAAVVRLDLSQILGCYGLRMLRRNTWTAVLPPPLPPEVALVVQCHRLVFLAACRPGEHNYVVLMLIINIVTVIISIHGFKGIIQECIPIRMIVVTSAPIDPEVD